MSFLSASKETRNPFESSSTDVDGVVASGDITSIGDWKISALVPLVWAGVASKIVPRRRPSWRASPSSDWDIKRNRIVANRIGAFKDFEIVDNPVEIVLARSVLSQAWINTSTRSSWSPKVPTSRRDSILRTFSWSAVSFFLCFEFFEVVKNHLSRIHLFSASWTISSFRLSKTTVGVSSAVAKKASASSLRISLPFGSTNISLRNAMSILVVPPVSNQALSKASDSILGSWIALSSWIDEASRDRTYKPNLEIVKLKATT